MQEIKPLTSLRGFAALAVVMQHFSATAQGLTPEWIPSLVPHGYMAVDFFFVLSGFIMCLIYQPTFQAEGIHAFPGFMLKRVARIVPLNVAVLLALMLAGLLSRGILGENIFFKDTSLAFDLPANLLMLQGLGIGTNLNGPSWSISTEFAAYFLFPLFVGLMFHRRRAVWMATLALALIVLVMLANRMPNFGLGIETATGGVTRCFTEFVFGMGAYRLYIWRGAANGQASDHETGLLLAAAVFGLIAGVDVFVALLCPFIVVATALNRGAIARFLSRPIPYFLGLVSFSVYLIHGPMRPALARLFSALHPAPLGPLGALSFALVGSLLTIPLAWLCYRWVERPGRDFIRRSPRRIVS